MTLLDRIRHHNWVYKTARTENGMLSFKVPGILDDLGVWHPIQTLPKGVIVEA